MRVKCFLQHQPIGIRMSVFCHRSIPVYLCGQSSRNGSNGRDKPWKKEKNVADIDPHRYSWFGCQPGFAEVDGYQPGCHCPSGHDLVACPDSGYYRMHGLSILWLFVEIGP